MAFTSAIPIITLPNLLNSIIHRTQFSHLRPTTIASHLTHSLKPNATNFNFSPPAINPCRRFQVRATGSNGGTASFKFPTARSVTTMHPHQAKGLYNNTANSMKVTAEEAAAQPESTKGSLVHECEVDVPASEVWEVYGTIQLPKVIKERLTALVANIDIEGDGAVGTVLHITYRAGPTKFQREVFVKIDNKQRVKEVDVVEGGNLELGFSSYGYIFEIIEKGSSSSVIRSTVKYEIGDDAGPDVVSYASTAPVAAIAEAVVEHLREKKASNMSA